jgi:flagellar biogenesis protein FliO
MGIRAGLRWAGAAALAGGLAFSAWQPTFAEPTRRERERERQRREASRAPTPERPAVQNEPAPSAARDPRLNDINDAWLREIQRRSDPASGAAPASERAPGEAQFNNPGATAGEPAPANETGDAGAPSAAGEGANAPAPAGDPGRRLDPAEDPEGAARLFPREAEEGPSFLGSALRFVTLMALLVGLFYLTMRYLRRKSGFTLPGHNDLMHVIASTTLVQGKFLQIVDVAGKLYVLGVSDAGVQVVGEMDDGIAADRIRMWQSSRRPTPPEAPGLASLIGALKGGDFRFWIDKHKQPAANFAELLHGQGAGAPRAAAPQSVSDAESDGEAGDESADLKQLLQQQKRRLAALKRSEP